MNSFRTFFVTGCAAALCLAPFLAVPASGAPDWAGLVAEAAKYESGQSLQPLWQIEQLVREAAADSSLRAGLEAALVKLLAPSSTFEARRFACQQLGIIGSDASLPALADLLKSEEMAGIACLALCTKRCPKVCGILREALPGASGSVRLQIIGALGNQQDAGSVGALAALAGDGDAAVACAAVVALGKIGNEPAREAVAALKKEGKPAIAWAVRDASLRMGL